MFILSRENKQKSLFFYSLQNVKGTPDGSGLSAGLGARGFRQFFEFSVIIIIWIFVAFLLSFFRILISGFFRLWIIYST